MYRSFFKRPLDAALAAVALILLAPVMLLVIIAIRIEDGGPPIFRQLRVGREGGLFTILKFRSMPVATPNLPSAAATQLRITRVGGFIRRSNLDELPQLVNILRGDMSLIGPRPAMPTQTTLLEQRRAHGVLAARPGLTGLAQVNAYDGMPESEKVDWERRYLERITFWGDVRIIGLTVAYLFKPPPVY